MSGTKRTRTIRHTRVQLGTSILTSLKRPAYLPRSTLNFAFNLQLVSKNAPRISDDMQSKIVDRLVGEFRCDCHNVKL